jgi:dephospho-CoA kinase
MIIALTGPIGSGKSEVAKILSRHGFKIVDADRLGHELLTPQTETWGKVVHAFGVRVLNRGGVVNRKKLGEIVFGDKKALAKLDSIMHPPLKARIAEVVKEFKNSPETKLDDILVINAALPQLFEGLADKVILVNSKPQNRFKRLIKKGWDKPQALKRINSQVPQKKYNAIADFIINNDSTLKKLNEQVQTRIQL